MTRCATMMAAAFSLATLGGCGSSGSDTQVTIQLSAASSLSEALADPIAAFEQETGYRVVANYGGSNVLVEQVIQGANADVLITASEASFQRAIDEAEFVDPVVLGINSSVLVSPKGSGINSVSDLSLGDPVISVCDPQVPCGELADVLFEDSQLDRSNLRLSEEADAATVLQRVLRSEVDAAVIYHSDWLCHHDEVHELANGTATTTDYVGGSVTEPGRELLDFLVDHGDIPGECEAPNKATSTSKT